MPRNLPTGLAEALKRGTLETHGTLELTLPDSATGARTLYFATAPVTVGGVKHSAQLRDTSAMKQSLTRAADRVTVDLQNVDTVLGIELINASESFYGARVRFGRYWRDIGSGAIFHKYLLTGAVVGVDVNENTARLALVSDAYAALNVGAAQPVVRNCRWEVIGGYKGPQCGSTSDFLTCNYLLDHADGCSARHSGTNNRARFGGFAYIKSQAAVAGAAGLAVPAVNQLVKTDSATFLQRTALEFTGGTVTDDAVNDRTKVNLLTAGREYAIHAITDYNAISDGSGDTTAELQAAVDAAITEKRSLYLPAGEYLANLDFGDDVLILGDGQLSTIIKGFDDSIPVIKTTGSRVRIRDVGIEGSGSGTTGEHGIHVTGITAGLEIRNVQIKSVGGCGIKADQWFSGVISDVDVDFAGLDGIDLNETAAGPSVMLVNCYVHSIEPGFAAYRLRRGYFWLLNCNSLDGPLASGETTCVIVGQTTTGGLDGTTSVAFAHFQNCNFESYRTLGVQFRGASTGSFDECVWAGNIAGALPVEFIDGGAARRGYLGATCQFGNSDDRVTNYPNAREIECPGLPPLTIVGPVGSFGSFAGVTDYYDTTLSRVEYLLRTDGALSTITATGDYTAHIGTRLIDCQVSAPATITIPWAGEAQAGYVITVQDGSGNAATHNLTIAAAGGSAIDGAGSRTINVDRGALTFVSNGTNWTTIASAPNGASQRVAVYTDVRTLGSDGDLTFDGFNLTSGRVYHSGGNAGAPGIAPSGDNTTGFFSVASGKYGFSSGGEKLRFQANGLFIREGNRITWDDSETRFDLYGSGSPEGAVTAGISSTYRRSDGGAGTALYVKESGTGNTGWVAVGAGGANTALSNLASVAINTTLVSDTNNTDDLGTSAINWKDLYLAGTFALAARSDPGSPTDSDVWRSSARNAISARISGQTEDLSATMWRSSAESNFSSTTTATSVIADTGVGTKTVAANRLVVGNQIRITAGGVYSTKASSAGTFTLRVRTGGSTMLTAVFTLPDGVADQVWSMEAVGAVNTTGSSGVIYWRLAWLMTDSSGLVYMPNVTVDLTAINTTVSRALDITGQFSVSDADNYFQTTNATIEVLA